MPFDIEDQRYIQSQYGASPTIKNILNSFRAEINPKSDIDLFINNVMNVRTANGAGLDIWGQIVSAERQLKTDAGDVITLDDENYRNYILFKGFSNIADASLATLNGMTKLLYNDNTLICVNVLTQNSLPNGDYYNSTPMRVRFTWRSNDVDDIARALFSYGIISCLAAGVRYDTGVITEDPLFGFYGSGLNPFNQGAFGVIYNINISNYQ